MIGKKRDTIAHTTVEYHRARRRLGRERDLEKVGTTFGSPLGLDLRLPRNPLKCRKWNLVWVGRNKVAALEPNEVETLLGFPRSHTRGGGISRTDRK
ncbi:DNA (cytosine-5)-methyltransferase DRM2 [Glycine soja]|uniref:SAM-dependent MTase DRM-type domain-containing protein n=2 Tax=Glycine subgen. Soja TaxID=1462606 RepID=A0A0R0EUN1_SOYBN|nr:DNA (cytosine-5)-methyltransferase DRM2 [Glycine soja]